MRRTPSAGFNDFLGRALTHDMHDVKWAMNQIGHDYCAVGGLTLDLGRYQGSVYMMGEIGNMIVEGNVMGKDRITKG